MIVEECLKPIDKKWISNIPESLLKQMYSTMLRIRVVEEKVAELVSQGEVKSPCHLYIGQEAVATGVCASLRKEDYVFSTHRSHGHYIAKGGDIKALMAELYGRVGGCSRGRGGSMHLSSTGIGFPGSSAIVGGTIPIAVGAAFSFYVTGIDNVAVAFFGDGATNEGVFYESLNLASLKKLPVIFVCENNFYSTHMHTSAIQSDVNLYKKAEVFNMSGIRINGNNVLEVYRVAKKAIEDARHGKGPTLIECLTYRWRGHVGPSWDVDKGLRDQEEVDWWINNCAIRKFATLLLSENILTGSERRKINNSLEKEVQEAVLYARNSPYPDEDEVSGKHVYAPS